VRPSTGKHPAPPGGHGGPRRDGGRDLRGLGGPSLPAITEVPSPPEVRRRELLFRRALIAADVLAVLAALLLSAITAGTPPPAFALLGVPLLVLGGKIAGLYNHDELVIRKSTTLDEAPALFSAATVLALLAALGGADGWPSGGALPALWLSLVGLLVALRSAARKLALRYAPAERCLVVGDADACAQLSRRLADSPHMNSRVLGYVPLRGRIRAEDPEPLGALDDLDGIVGSHGVHRVIVAPRDSGADPSLDVVLRAKALGVKVSVLPRILEVVGSSAAFDDVDGLTVLGVRRFGLVRSSAFVKRSLDLAGSALGLVVLAPLLALLAVAIRLGSRGPVLFRQERVGRDGHGFRIAKFRTMVADAETRKGELLELNETAGLFKIAADPRVTRVGRWLRRTSLDELPQLFNVLRGEMSLVGPRPLVPEEDRQVVGWHRRRLHIKPGMTGPWQILGSARIPLYEMVKIDYLYVANWSLWGDVKILLRTALYALSRRNR